MESIFVPVSTLQKVWENLPMCSPRLPNKASVGEQAPGAASQGVHSKDLGHFWSLGIKGSSMVLCVDPFEMIIGCET